MGLGIVVVDLSLQSDAGLKAFASHVTPRGEARAERKPGFSVALAYSFLCLVLILAGMAGVWWGNKAYGPEMYADNGLLPAVEAFEKGQNYTVFDLNLNIRKLHELQVSRMTKTPDVVIIGASHWQEAHSDLLKGMTLYNSHIHRDFWEDLLGAPYIFAANNRLPKRMIISIRDNQFRPISTRPDFLWEPGIANYRLMADKIGVEKENYWTTFPYQRIRQLFSISMLFDNLTRWHNADVRPHSTTAVRTKTLDTLMPDGSIMWSDAHLAFFSQERMKKEALALAEMRRNDPPQVEQRGVDSFEKLLEYLKSQGTTVYLAQPPFNPVYYDNLQGSTYFEGLQKVDALTREIAARHGLKMIGGFNPHKVGCTPDMYIDAEHSNPTCLQKIFDEFAAIVKSEGGK
jgi:hypothetical protein